MKNILLALFFISYSNAVAIKDKCDSAMEFLKKEDERIKTYKNLGMKKEMCNAMNEWIIVGNKTVIMCKQFGTENFNSYLVDVKKDYKDFCKFSIFSP